ncbi:amidohydrolase [Streptomyces sp. VRA16 Mangrove soil]|uniref:amidohydrolase n=1 Tax=Streptomyces sp. VRA16 Mangrove soil TaxID=2817434 RepID=UPI001A9E6455|nr:amidohydrolase [Streptomyces sp. VRA16 Mangrove soil]MBO1330691.1 amidohydrolase [Streptomyces sp. VRA16 Mangrove soil]
MAHQVIAGLATIKDELADLYRDLHAHPELSLQETRTAALLAERLRAAGFDEVAEGVGGTGVVGVLRAGEGPVVMLRADFDALPVEEKTGLPYASRARGVDQDGQDVPVMHACGHDMHAACLVGAATLLAQAKDRFKGTLLVVFQPAEELARGARDMIADGLFERFPKPEIVLGQHVGPLPAGFIGHGTGPLMASSDSLNVTLHGRGAHGSRPEASIDPVLMAANVVTRLQGIVSREVPPSETAVVTVGRLQAGTKDNVIPETAELGINLRAYTPQTRTQLRAAVERIVRGECRTSDAPRDPDLAWSAAAPALVSDPEATSTTVAALRSHFGPARMLDMPQVNASEDVGVFGDTIGVPTVFWFWGGLETQTVVQALQDGTLDQLPSNHSPFFAPLVEPTLSTGVEALVVAALTWLRTD